MKPRRHPLITGILIISLLPLFIGSCSNDSVYTEISTASIERVGTSELALTWSGSNVDTVDVYWSTSPSGLDSGGTLLIIGASGGTAAFDDPSPTARPYFKVKAKTGLEKIVAERILPVGGVGNFRDIGGYKTTDGKSVKWGIFFRSAHLAAITEEGKAYMQNSGIKTIIDYRADTEIASNPDPAISGIEYIRLIAVSTANVSGSTISKIRADELGAPGEYLTQLNRNLVNLDTVTYKQLLNLLLDPAKRPLLEHCTAGKDRTGFGAAIVLLALGVPKETVMQDYLLSNTYLAASNQATLNAAAPYLTTDQLEVLKALLEVREEYLQAAFDEMVAQYGSIDAYLEQGLELTPARRSQLKSLMLE